MGEGGKRKKGEKRCPGVGRKKRESGEGFGWAWAGSGF